MNALLLPLAVILIVGGMTCLAAGMTRTHALRGRPSPPSGTLARRRLAGGLLLAAALLPCVLEQGAGIGPVLWTGLLTAGVLAVAGGLAVERLAAERRRKPSVG
jgi:hypothetical protein